MYNIYYDLLLRIFPLHFPLIFASAYLGHLGDPTDNVSYSRPVSLSIGGFSYLLYVCPARRPSTARCRNALPPLVSLYINASIDALCPMSVHTYSAYQLIVACAYTLTVTKPLRTGGSNAVPAGSVFGLVTSYRLYPNPPTSRTVSAKGLFGTEYSWIHKE